MNIKPLKGNVLLQPVNPEHQTPGGIIIPETITDKSRAKEYDVLAVGPGVPDKRGKVRKLDVKPGDRVIMEKAYAWKGINLPDGLILCPEEDILCIL